MLAVLILQLWVVRLAVVRPEGRHLGTNCDIYYGWVDVILPVITEAHEVLLVLRDLLELVVVQVKLMLCAQLFLGHGTAGVSLFALRQKHASAALDWVQLEGAGRDLRGKEVWSSLRNASCGLEQAPRRSLILVVTAATHDHPRLQNVMRVQSLIVALDTTDQERAHCVLRW